MLMVLCIAIKVNKEPFIFKSVLFIQLYIELCAITCYINDHAAELCYMLVFILFFLSKCVCMQVKLYLLY